MTLKDVAEHCGVSTATVSAVVNGADWVSQETRSRVQQAVEDLDYRPNQLARGLKTRQGYAIGAIVSDLTNPFFTEIVRGLSHALHDDERNLFLCDSDHRFDVGDRNFQMLLDRQVDGIVLIGDTVPEKVIEHYMRRPRPVPVVAIERDYDIAGVNCLLVDSEQGGYLAATHLIEQGYRRIAMIAGPHEGAGSTTYGRVRRLEGYARALREAGRPVDPALIAEGNFRYAGGEAAMRYLLGLDERPDAVFAANDLMALGAAHAAQKAGLRIPRDLALVGYDDIPIAALTQPGLTTLAMPKRELGRTAAELLRDQIPKRGAHDAVRRIFSAELVVRDSSVPRGGTRVSGG